MPYVALRDGVRLFFEAHGEGNPLAMIEGLGCSRWIWFKQLRVLPNKYCCIVFDNRGAGLSDKPDEPYTIEVLVEDLKELLDFLSVDKCHILGVSTGGFIAQEFALRYPSLVASLVLVSTHSGGQKVTQKEIMKVLLSEQEDFGLEESLRKKISLAFNQDYMEEHPDEVDQILSWIIEDNTPRYALIRQLEAACKFDLGDRISRIKAPTLIVAGTNDKIIHYKNCEMMAETMPNARLILFENGSHFLFIEEDKLFNRLVINFLAEVESGDFRREPKKLTIKGKWGLESELL